MDRPALPKEDLFETSTMTFGEHLDELRRSLVRAIAWLIIGALIALAVLAKPVVRMIQGPLEAAIIQYQADRSISKFTDGIAQAAETDQARMASLRAFMLEKGLSWQQMYVPMRDLLAAEQAATQPATQPATAPQAKSATATNPATPQKAPAEPKSTVPAPDDFTLMWILTPTEAGLNSHQIEEPFMIYIKASVVIGAVLGSPMIFYHLWSFVAAGLYPHERKYVYMYLPFSVSLFIFGVLLAFFAVLKYVLEFLLDFNSTLSVDLEPRLSYYMSFVLFLPLGFGIAFQLPLVMLFLQRIGIFETSAYEKSWRIAVLVISVLSMILTPSDPYSMLFLMCPLIVLYFLGIGLCRFMPRGRGLGSAAYDPR